MNIRPLHRSVHLPLIAAALLLSALSFARWRAAGTIGLDVVFPPDPAAGIIGILFFVAVLLIAYGYYNAVLRCDELGLTLDRTLTLAKALAIISFIGMPLLSNDIYIYLSCGQAPLNGFNPYTDVADLAASIYHRFVPPIWAEGPYCKYGPAALSLAQFAAFIGGPSPIAGLFVWKLLSLGAFFLFCDAVALLLKRLGNAGGAAGPLILLSPLLWVQGVGQGHNDLFAVLFLTGSLLALLYRRWILGALLLTAGAQIKLYLLPLFLLALFLWYRDEGLSRRSVTTLTAATLLSGLLAALLYVPYWGGAASLRALYEPLLAEEPMNNLPYLIPYGLNLLFPALVPYEAMLQTALRTVLLAAVAAVTVWQVVRLARRRDEPFLVFLRIMVLVVCFTSLRFHSWYFIAVLPLFAAGTPRVWLRWGAWVFPLTLLFDIHNFVPRDSWVLLALLPAAVVLVNLLFLFKLPERLTGRI